MAALALFISTILTIPIAVSLLAKHARLNWGLLHFKPTVSCRLFGTNRTTSHVHSMVAIGGKADVTRTVHFGSE